MRTYAPRGQTPILQVPLTKDHLSVISGITPEGKLFHMGREVAFHGEEVVIFLRHLLRHLTGTLLILRAVARLRHKRHIIQACIQQTGYLETSMQRSVGCDHKCLGGVLLDPRRLLACFQRSSTTKDPSFDTTSTTAQLVRAKGQHR